MLLKMQFFREKIPNFVRQFFNKHGNIRSNTHGGFTDIFSICNRRKTLWLVQIWALVQKHGHDK